MPLSSDQKIKIDDYLYNNKYYSEDSKLYTHWSKQPLRYNKIYTLGKSIKNKMFKRQEIKTKEIIDYICTEHKLPLTAEEICSLYSQYVKPENPVGPPLPTPTVDPGVARENRAVRREMLLLKKALRKTTKEKEPPSKKQRTR